MYHIFNFSSLHAGLFFMLLLSSADFFQNYLNYFSNINRVSNGLDPDQDQQSVGPDLGPNCFQSLSADDKSLPAGKELRIV